MHGGVAVQSRLKRSLDGFGATVIHDMLVDKGLGLVDSDVSFSLDMLTEATAKFNIKCQL